MDSVKITLVSGCTYSAAKGCLMNCVLLAEMRIQIQEMISMA